MAVHGAFRHHKRQTDPLAVPTAAGISAEAVTQSDTAVTATALAINTRVSTHTSDSDATIDGFSIADSLPTTSASSASIEPSATSSEASTSGSASSNISLSTVVGACVGTLAGVIVLILVAFWLYKRSDPKQKGRSNATRSPHDDNWNKLKDDEDRWHGMSKTKEIAEIAPMEKLTMFKKSTPSVRTAYTAKTMSEEAPTFNLDTHPFAQYHPKLAQELASADGPPAPPFLNQKDSVAVSWDGDTVGSNSFLSLRSGRLSGAMSPSLDMAIPTPALTSSEPHRWESAEVIDFEGQTAEIVDPSLSSDNPFVHPVERRKSQNNPFFNAQSSVPVMPKLHVSTKVRELTANPTNTNPFEDDTEKTPVRPAFTHVTVDSMSSVSSNDRAIQSLIAALDTTPEDIHERLRVASMQPSIITESGASMYTSAGEEDDVTEAFPLPPSSSRSS